MTALVGALVGLLTAAGVALVARGLVGVTPPLHVFAAELNHGRTGNTDRWGWLIGESDELGANLELVGWTRNEWRVHRLQFIAAVGGFAVVLAVLLTAVGFTPVVSVIPAVAIGTVAGWWLSLAHLKEVAGSVKTEASATVAVFLTLVQALMAAGAGPNGAMTAAVLAGQGRVFRLMRDAMMDAQLNNAEPWVGLGELGRRLDIADLVSLASSLRQASEGASVGESLTAKAASLRDRDRYRREADMVARSESMSLPLVGMALAFVVLIGYPAVALLLST